MHKSKNINIKVQKILIKSIRFLLDIVIYFKRALQFFLLKILNRPIRFFSKKFFGFILVPSYKVYFKTRNKLKIFLGLNQQTNLYLITNRKVIHIIIVFLTVATALTNWQTGETRAEGQVGKDIILSSLIKNDQLGSLLEESVGKFVPQVTNYIDKEGFLVESLPGLVDNEKDETRDSVIATTQDESTLIKPEIPSSGSAVPIDSGKRDKTTTYIVQKGDNIGSISQKFNLSNTTLLWNNNLTGYSIIRPGDTLVIPPDNGVLHIVKDRETLLAISTKYKVDVNKIIDYNNLVNVNDITVNQKLFIPGGQKEVTVAPTTLARVNRSKLTNLIIPDSASIVSKTQMLWPTSTKRITQYFNWRHSGLDIATKAANVPIYAAEDGVVSLSKSSGWNGGYGIYIIISHAGNKKTLYGHLSKNFVKVGEKVVKGQVIGIMGNTGRSTGQHLHFEVRIGNTRVNPLKYTK